MKKEGIIYVLTIIVLVTLVISVVTLIKVTDIQRKMESTEKRIKDISNEVLYDPADYAFDDYDNSEYEIEAEGEDNNLYEEVEGVYEP